MTSTLASALEQTQQEERRRAARALLATPVLAARGRTEGAYRLVRRHEQHLRQWFDHNTGWRLTVDGSVARLHKRVPGTDPTRGLSDGRRPFSRRRYVLLALALAVLERGGAQITLGRLAEEVITALAEPRLEGIAFTLACREERGDMVAVVRLLLDLGALRRIEGDEQQFVVAGGDVLYDIEHGVLAGLLATAANPSTVPATTFPERLAAVTERPADPEARTRGLRWSLTRRLLDDPVLYLDDLGEEERAYLANQRRSIADRIEEATGLVAEIRAEGIAMVDPADSLSDVKMPEGGAPGHLALLLAERLAKRGRLHRGDLERLTARLQREHTTHWGRGVLERAPGELTADAVQRLRALALVTLDGDDVVARPALSRYRLGAVRTAGAS